MCRTTVRWLRRLDWVRRLEFADMNRVDQAELPFAFDDAMRGMPMRTRDGRRLIGFQAVRRALMQTPVGALGAWALYLPGVRELGARVYARIATRRRRDARPCAIGGTP